MRWMFLPYRRYVDFSGRSQRREYWMFHLLWFSVLLALWLLAFAAVRGGDAVAAKPVVGACLILAVLFLLGSLVPMVAVTVRRFHDQDKSGWYCLINLIPYVGGLVVLIFMCLDGTPGSNTYGPDPKGPDDRTVFR